ncbi:DUF1292 domain-containing protein [Bacillus massilioanorexius]|uniref:DUF1292 domain-containing protein n=1 Tax=Bacillus TaxID=1386 RepID=UPI00031B2EF1|nr:MULTISPECIES: DUF1292 domain-containing protein [Bacillus]
MMNEHITIVDENGNEQLCEIMFNFHSDEFNKDYVLCYPVGEEDENGEVLVHAYAYVPADDDSEGELMPIETEEEWDLIEEMYNTFVSEQEDEE